MNKESMERRHDPFAGVKTSNYFGRVIGEGERMI